MNDDVSANKGGVPIRPKDSFLIFGAPCIGEEEIAEVVATMRSGWLGTGPRVQRFEEIFRHYKQEKYALAVNSCTAAIHLSLLACGIGKGDEVISTAMTFCATINAIVHSGATPVIVDCEPHSMNIDPEAIADKITSRTKAILIVHFAGRPCNMQKIMKIATKHGLKVIEDCAHAIESEYQGKKVGTFGDFGCFSFYATKNIVTGEGGMVITNSEQYAGQVKSLALHGMSQDAWKRFGDEGYKHYKVTHCGFKYNMMDLQAAIGIHQMKRIEPYWKKRKTIWELYLKELSGLPIELPHPPEVDTRHAFHLFTIRVNEKVAGCNRDYFLSAMNKENIGVGVHYVSIPEHPFYQETFGWRPEDYPNALVIGRETVSLPISAKLSEQDVQDVIKATKKILKSK